MGKMARQKGARGEREAKQVLIEILAPLYARYQQDPPRIERNLMQNRSGGYDLVGLDWLALEVKRREKVELREWWEQTLRQTQEGQIPLLMWKQNYRPWRFRTRLWAVRTGALTVDLDRENFEMWLRSECSWRLSREVWVNTQFLPR